MKGRNILFLVGGLLIGAAIGYSLLVNSGNLFGGGARNDAPALGKPAPSFVLSTIEGEQVRVEDWKGKAVILNFWATWCKPCKQEMPLFEKYYRQNDGELLIVAINYDESVSTIQDFLATMELSFPVLLDPGAVITDQYLVNAFPTSFFIDSDGVMQGQYIGSIPELVLKNYLTKIGIGE